MEVEGRGGCVQEQDCLNYRFQVIITNSPRTGHSWCLSTAGRAVGSLCLFEKTLCIDCPNAIIDERHIGVWREIERQQIEVLACADLGVGGRRRAERFLAGARAVLARLQPTGQGVAQ